VTGSVRHMERGEWGQMAVESKGSKWFRGKGSGGLGRQVSG
jgi:hypothetical protein